MKSTIESLLSEIKTINESYNRIKRATGENFNVFNVLGMKTNEVYCHSAIIAELLDPNGSHDQGLIFLDLFLKVMKLDDFDVNNVMVTKEKYFGEINEKLTTGGRIDIVIENKSHAIVIENKIYAHDQKDQLLRYYNNLENQGKKPLLYYLTLYGSTPNEQEVAHLKKKNIEVIMHAEGPSFERNKVVLISYENTILDWLQLCVKESSNQPLLRETINQYINLVKYLTGKTMEDEHLKQIAKKMAEPANIEAAFTISQGMYEMKTEIIEKLRREISKRLNKYDLFSELECKMFNDNKQEMFIFFKRNWDFAIGFAYEHCNFYCGICSQEGKLSDEFLGKLKNLNNYLKSSLQREKEYFKYWPVWETIDDRDWDVDHTPWMEIMDDNKTNMLDEVEECIGKLHKIIEEYYGN